MSELLPCPHCGEMVEPDMSKTKGLYYQHCFYCGARGPGEYKAADAIAAWNRRVSAPDREEVLTALLSKVLVELNKLKE